MTSVGRALDGAGIRWVRLNSDDLLTNLVIHAEPRDGVGSLTIKDSGRRVDLGSIAAVWYRKPDTPHTGHLPMDSELERKFIGAEAYETLLSIYSLIHDRPWINNPFSTRLSHRRFYQLRSAARVGLELPRSVYSNDSANVLRFASSLEGRLAIKTLSPVVVSAQRANGVREQYGVLTRPLTLQELERLSANVPNFPTFLQEFIEKAADWRITCTRQKIFACKIHSQEVEHAKEDFRVATRSLRHELVDIPAALRRQLWAYMELVGLEFGCFDFVETSDGRLVFLECNPNGQWLWIEQMTGAPISNAIASVLSDMALSQRA